VNEALKAKTRQWARLPLNQQKRVFSTQSYRGFWRKHPYAASSRRVLVSGGGARRKTLIGEINNWLWNW